LSVGKFQGKIKISPENTRSYQPGKTETNRKKLSPSEKKKNLNGGVAILLKKNRFWLI
jgi:hypothetical protein